MEQRKSEPGRFFEKSCFATNKKFFVDDSNGERFWIKPSDIVLPIEKGKVVSTFFSGAFGKAEVESTAYLVCKFFKEHGNCWYPISFKTLNKYVVKNDPDLKGWCRSLSETDYVDLNSDDKMSFSNLFIERCAGFRALNEPERWKVKNVFESFS